MPYKLKLSEETDPVKIAKRRVANNKKQKEWVKKFPEKNRLRRKRGIYKFENKRIEFQKKYKNECSQCGYNKNSIALDFHHLDKNKKDFKISEHYNLPEKDLLKEIKKCIVLCANCHRIEHYNEKQRNKAQ
jgi:hypothetical protein